MARGYTTKQMLNCKKIAYRWPTSRYKAGIDERIGDDVLVETAERVRRRALIVPGGGLRRHRTLARQAEPRICAVTTEFGRSQFDDLQSRLNRKGDLACRAARRTDFAWRTFRAADQAQPQAAWRKYGGDLCREPLPLVWFIEHVEATAVEHKLERPIGRRRGENVPCSKAAAQIASSHFGLGSFDRKWRDIDSEHFETALRHPNRIGAGTGPDLK